MRITIDTETRTLVCEDNKDEKKEFPLYSDDAFNVLSRYWIKVGWNQKYPYTFSWFGRPFIQLPEDVLRIQEVIWRVKPDVIIETGVAHGGSLVFYATLCEAMKTGRVIGIDIEIRPANRRAIEEHPLAGKISLIEGSSTAPEIVKHVRSQVKPGETCLVILDSCHTKKHVQDELEAYHSLVTPGSYIVATDGIMLDLDDVPSGHAEWREDNPAAAALEFAAAHPEFVAEQPAWLFNESSLSRNLTHWPNAYLRRT
jgi:cephalosporin hydroxylase